MSHKIFLEVESRENINIENREKMAGMIISSFKNRGIMSVSVKDNICLLPELKDNATMPIDIKFDAVHAKGVAG